MQIWGKHGVPTGRKQGAGARAKVYGSPDVAQYSLNLDSLEMIKVKR